MVDIRQSCACGRRFRITSLRVGHARGLLELRGPLGSPARDHPPDDTELWEEDKETPLGKVGVVPVGTAVLHSPTQWFAGPAAELRGLAARMQRTMSAARGIGLAANQVGADVRMIAHDIPECAPSILVNPVRVSASGNVVRSEGCLSLNVPLAHGQVSRWRTVTIVADLLDGRRVVLEANEMLAKVIQHELDHLDGIEYVQRTHGRVREDVYSALESANVDTQWLPVLGPETATAY